MTLKQIVERTDTTAGKLFDIGVQILIVISLVTFALDTLPELNPAVRHSLSVAEYVIVAIFTLEYVLRIAVSDRKLAFIFSFYGLLDLVAIAPFYLAVGLDLRSVRVFRLLRLVRVFKLLRYTEAASRLYRAFLITKEEIVLFTAITIMLLYLSAVGMYYFERDAQLNEFASVFHSLWWAIATLTTVGYGDVYPVTVGGRVFTFLILLLGLGIVAVPSGLLASALTKVRGKDDLKGNA